jgi:hypothetical protein
MQLLLGSAIPRSRSNMLKGESIKPVKLLPYLQENDQNLAKDPVSATKNDKRRPGNRITLATVSHAFRTFPEP